MKQRFELTSLVSALTDVGIVARASRPSIHVQHARVTSNRITAPVSSPLTSVGRILDYVRCGKGSLKLVVIMLPPGTRLGRYEIRAHIGTGGMGEIYLAQDVELERILALKILPAEFASDPGRMRRFIQEARAASGLNHPNILTIYEINHEGTTPFIATEYIDGLTLRKRIKGGPVPVMEALDTAIQIASALGAAHQAGIVHRDVKPENVMLR